MKKLTSLFTFLIAAIILALGSGCHNEANQKEVKTLKNDISIDTGNFADIVEYIRLNGEDASNNFLQTYILRTADVSMTDTVTFKNFKVEKFAVLSATKYVKNDSIFHIIVSIGEPDENNNIKKTYYTYYIQPQNVTLEFFDSTRGTREYFISEMKSHYNNLLDEYVNEDNQ